ncbi:DUF1579 domain-containing protein [Candidatus Laterigemmans baculatus]|uniref:DUF1579 domain-containing protein n=1 Tax=Candidatus Laterigemmans baculatus TaxID=2770505 RepID=UPI0013D95A8B|nr:DUF1579 domain-containing protein [Candidatus Laterigemmans baculatus]
MFAKPQAEHRWLAKLVGDWNVESDYRMGADQPSKKSESRISVRSLEGMWVVMESGGDSPEMGKWSSLLTLGYDPRRKQYVGTFFGSMMNHLWIYAGSLDDSGRVLTLDTEGPRFEGEGLVAYQDIFESVDDDHWILSSRVRGDDGQWQHFMTAHHRRVK